ncbi:MAG: hypothetical protein PHS60_01080 [Zavarzinia sp.]|nr:hypothetical protein [Zavarzinia sp.]
MIERIVAELAVLPAGPVLVALMIDRLWPRRSAQAPRVVQRTVAILIRRLDRPERPTGTRRMRGFLLWSSAALVALALGAAVAWGIGYLPGSGWRFGGEVLLLAVSIGYQGARSAARRAITGVEGLGPAQGRRVGQVACARLAMRFSDGVVATTLAFMLAGLPGLFLVKVGQWLVEGVERDRNGDFGLALRSVHGVVTLPAGWLAAVLIGLGRVPPSLVLPPPAPAALESALDRAGFGETLPGQRIGGARTVVDRAHALWFVLLLGGTIAARSL